MNRVLGATFVAAIAALALAGQPARAADFDAEAAQALIKKNECTKCHAVDKDKKGPSYKKVAEKLKGKPDAVDKIIKNITTGPKVKLDDGTEEEHTIIKTKDQAELTNLVQWILAH